MSTLLHRITGVNRATQMRAGLLVAVMAGMLVLVGQELARLQAQGSDQTAAFSPQQVAFFEKQVQPLLRQHCWKCHGEDPSKLRGGLDLRTRSAILQGGDSGPAVDLRQPDKSLLLQAVHYKDEHIRMPPKGKLSEAEIAILEKWVKDGLPVPTDRMGSGVKSSPGGHAAEEAKKYWAYQPVRRPSVPAVRNTSWVRTPIDAFILARLEEHGLQPVPPADKVTLIRRAYFDLLGLPPTPEQIDAFVQDTSPQAWERLIDQLLASPHYGEKWGRHWLDVVRYAETNGFERDGPKPFVWRYRDYVIRSFNDDKPFDRFILEQLAGDELPGYQPEAIIATGFYRLGIWDDEPADPEQALYDHYDDILTTVGQAFLGMTINCARCHEHKADPIPQADYYRLLAFFREIRPFSQTRDVRSPNNLTDISPPEVRAKYEAEWKQRQARLAEIRQRMTAIEDAAIRQLPAEDQRAAEGPDRPKVVAKVIPRLTGASKQEYEALRKERSELERRRAPEGQELALSVNNCWVPPPPTRVLVRGSPHAPGKEVQPGWPQLFGLPDPAIPSPPPGARTSGRRTVLARWIASPDNPLTARVLVNRIWQYHFGRGIVPTANDFGKLGEPPSHPELLDWLAVEFVQPTAPDPSRPWAVPGPPWTIKRMHKLIMMSQVYQLSSRGDPDNLRRDPANVYLWRFNMRRLTGEEIRDAMLAVSGQLNLKMYGPSVYPKLPPEVLAGQSVPGQGWPTSPPEEGNRRSIYVHVKRSLRVPILVGFDQPDPDSSCPVRYVTTVPTQALGLLNGAFTQEQAAAFARRLQREAPGDLAAQVRRAIRLTTGRQPSEEEVQADLRFLQRLMADHQLDSAAALTRYCLLCLNTNEFVYID
jgi:mono/diheme cytochrome c family protein